MKEIINQIFAIKEKCLKAEIKGLERSLDRLDFELEQKGYQVIDPIDTIYKNEMTDLDARLNSELTAHSKIIKVLKPVIYKKDKSGEIKLVQKGIVIVD